MRKKIEGAKKYEKGMTEKILRVSKINVWLQAYLDESNPSTFLNKAGSARAAGYKTTNVHSLKAIGHQNFTKLSILISAWLEEAGLTETVLKLKLVQLMEGKQTIFQKVKGSVDQSQLPEHCKVMAVSSVPGQSDDSVAAAGETLLAVDLENLELQRRTLDMALKVKGMYGPEKHEHSGKDGKPINHNLTMDEVAAQLLSEVAGATRGLPNRTQEKIEE